MASISISLINRDSRNGSDSTEKYSDLRCQIPENQLVVTQAIQAGDELPSTVSGGSYECHKGNRKRDKRTPVYPKS